MADLPAAPAQALDQEHVISIEMRAHAAAVRGITHHHVVDPPIGDEAERRYQRGDLGHMMIDGLDEQGPRLGAELAEARFGERTVLDLPGFAGPVAHLRDQARFDLFLAGKTGQRIGVERIAPERPGIPDPQRRLLPMFGQEAADVETL